MNPRGVLTLAVLFIFLHAYAQDKSPVKFGKVSREDFTIQAPSFDTSASAVIIADIGFSMVTPNKSGGFGYEFTRKMRAKIINKNGVDIGKFSIPLYSSRTGDSRENLKGLKAITYNLEGEKIVETKLESDQVFNEKEGKGLQVKKFSLPALKEGSIIEITYTIISDFLFEFRPWQFQGDYPCLWSEYEVEIPEYFHYVTLTQGYLPFHINTNKETSRHYLIRSPDRGYGSPASTGTISGMALQKRWVIKNVPSLNEESFTTTVDNHRSKLEFQLSAIVYPGGGVTQVMNSWAKASEELMQHENFGLQLGKYNGWLKDEMSVILQGAKDQHEQVKKIYAYVRDNFTCVQRSGKYTSNTLKNIFKQRSGNVADLNLLMTAMLEQAGIETYPILLSTRWHGVTHDIYPLMDRYNYVISAALVGDDQYFLDASIPQLGFGMLEPSCYNGHARVLTKDPQAIFLSPDSLLEKSVTLATVVGEKDKISGTIKTQMGIFNSLRQRGNIKESGEKALFDKIKTGMGSDFEISETAIDSLNRLEDPIRIRYNFTYKPTDPELIYFNPVLAEAYKENPFKSATRLYPVEMPYRLDDTYILTFQVPEGYMVDEIPKSTKVMLNDNEGYFEYLVAASGQSIQLRSRVILNKTVFNQEDYETLRNFFGHVVKKQAEQIVLKKNTRP